MFEMIFYGVGFFVITIIFQWLLRKVRKNHNQGDSAIWVGTGAVIVISIFGIVTSNVNYFAAVLGFILGDEVGKRAGWNIL